MSVYFNIRNTLPKSGTFLLGHPVYIYMILEQEFNKIKILKNNYKITKYIGMPTY